MDYMIQNTDGTNYTISTKDEALSMDAVREGWGVHDRIPGAFVVPSQEYAEATGASEEWLYSNEPVAIPDEIAVVRDDDGNAIRTEVSKWRVGRASEVSLPSLATQWKNDMRQRVAIARKHDPNAYPVLRMPESFIKTGRMLTV